MFDAVTEHPNFYFQSPLHGDIAMAKTGSSMKIQNKAVSETANQSQQISAEERRRMIAEAAYFRAMQRGFNGGDTLDDWLAAEREINCLLPGLQKQ
jgi:hypothetical protein